ncbi:FCS-Like Zinc finger 5-like [Curcuma longa]|uniref:FCS-Like Zinc finger 5-like n=1 Tax=Curcuma longa TaxID=136217 RepID=UPI003D9F487D
MAGLSVLLVESQESSSFPKYNHRISQTSLPKKPCSLSTSGGSFLERCGLCRRKLQEGHDIYMYRGDQGFCSEECRRQRMFMDEEGGWKEEKYGSLVREVVVPVERSRQEKVEYGGQAEELGSTSCRVK